MSTESTTQSPEHSHLHTELAFPAENLPQIETGTEAWGCLGWISNALVKGRSGWLPFVLGFKV